MVSMACHQSWNSKWTGTWHLRCRASLSPKANSLQGGCARDNPLCIRILPAKHNPRCTAASGLAFPPIIIPASVKLQTHSLAPSPLSLLHPGVRISSYPVRREPLRHWAAKSHGPTPQPHSWRQVVEKHPEWQSPHWTSITWGEQCNVFKQSAILTYVLSVFLYFLDSCKNKQQTNPHLNITALICLKSSPLDMFFFF